MQATRNGKERVWSSRRAIKLYLGIALEERFDVKIRFLL